MLHLETPASERSTGFAVVALRKLPDAEAAAAFVESEKTHWSALMEGAASESLCRVTLFGPGADAPLPWVGDTEVRTVHQWVSKEGYEAAKGEIRDGDESTDTFDEPTHMFKVK